MAGDVIISGGEVGRDVFVILDGQVQVARAEDVTKILSLLDTGDYFGEIAALYDHQHYRRIASVSTTSICKIGVIKY